MQKHLINIYSILFEKLKLIKGFLKSFVNKEAFIETTIGAIISAVIILSVSLYVFQLETQRIRNNERMIFQRNLSMLYSEIDENLTTFKMMREYSKQTYDIWFISDDIVKSLVSNPHTYIFTGMEFYTLLQQYLLHLNVMRKEIAVMADARSRGEGYDGLVLLLVPRIQHKVETMIYISYLLERQTMLYASIYRGGLFVMVPNYDEVVKEIKDIPIEVSPSATDKIKSMNKKMNNELVRVKNAFVIDAKADFNKKKELIQIEGVKAVLKMSTKEAEKFKMEFYQQLNDLQYP
jgi:hypothetical protein